MYSYMGLIVIIIVGISVGLSYLITDYFFRTKETELNQKGGEVALIVRYFNASGASSAMLSQYLTSVDQLIGARIWVFDSNYRLINASETMRDMEKDLRTAHDMPSAGAREAPLKPLTSSFGKAVPSMIKSNLFSRASMNATVSMPGSFIPTIRNRCSW